MVRTDLLARYLLNNLPPAKITLWNEFADEPAFAELSGARIRSIPIAWLIVFTPPSSFLSSTKRRIWRNCWRKSTLSGSPAQKLSLSTTVLRTTAPSVAAQAGATVVRHPYNIGNGAAIKSGIRAARSKFLVFMDGDGQHKPEDIPKLLKEAENFHMVVGARSKGSRLRFHRNVANLVYNFLATYVTQFPVKDLTSGFRVLERLDALRFIDLLPNTFSYPTTLTLAFLRSGLTVKYIADPDALPDRSE